MEPCDPSKFAIAFEKDTWPELAPLWAARKRPVGVIDGSLPNLPTAAVLDCSLAERQIWQADGEAVHNDRVGQGFLVRKGSHR